MKYSFLVVDDRSHDSKCYAFNNVVCFSGICCFIGVGIDIFFHGTYICYIPSNADKSRLTIKDSYFWICQNVRVSLFVKSVKHYIEGDWSECYFGNKPSW